MTRDDLPDWLVWDSWVRKADGRIFWAALTAKAFTIPGRGDAVVPRGVWVFFDEDGDPCAMGDARFKREFIHLPRA